MRKFNIRWWLTLPKFPEPSGLHSHRAGEFREGLCVECLFGVPTVPMVSKDETEGMSHEQWYLYMMLKKGIEIPVIGTFEPNIGDMGKDYDGPLAKIRTYLGSGQWHPYFEAYPRETGDWKTGSMGAARGYDWYNRTSPITHCEIVP